MLWQSSVQNQAVSHAAACAFSSRISSATTESPRTRKALSARRRDLDIIGHLRWCWVPDCHLPRRQPRSRFGFALLWILALQKTVHGTSQLLVRGRSWYCHPLSRMVGVERMPRSSARASPALIIPTVAVSRAQLANVFVSVIPAASAKAVQLFLPMESCLVKTASRNGKNRPCARAHSTDRAAARACGCPGRGRWMNEYDTDAPRAALRRLRV